MEFALLYFINNSGITRLGWYSQNFLQASYARDLRRGYHIFLVTLERSWEVWRILPLLPNHDRDVIFLSLLMAVKGPYFYSYVFLKSNQLLDEHSSL